MKKVFGVLIFCILLINVSFVKAETIITDKSVYFETGDAGKLSISTEGVKYHKNIEGKFLYYDEIYVSVLLKDNSGVVYSGTKEERHEQWKIQDKWFEDKMKEFLANLNEDYFIVDTRTSYSFSGLMTKDGFEYLKNNPNIEAIELTGGGHALSASTNITKLKWYVWLTFGLILIFIILLLIRLKNKKRKKF